MQGITTRRGKLKDLGTVGVKVCRTVTLLIRRQLPSRRAEDDYQTKQLFQTDFFSNRQKAGRIIFLKILYDSRNFPKLLVNYVPHQFLHYALQYTTKLINTTDMRTPLYDLYGGNILCNQLNRMLQSSVCRNNFCTP